MMLQNNITALLRRHRTALALAAIVALALAVRVWDLGGTALVADEFIDMNASYGYAQTGTWHAWDWNVSAPDTVDFYAARDERSWLYRWQIAQVLPHVAPTESAARIVSVLWGGATVLVVYWAAWIMTRRRDVALLAALLFALSATGIAYDRKVRMYAMFYPFYLALATLLYQMLTARPSARWGKFIHTVSTTTGVHLPYIIPMLVVGAISAHLQLLTANIAFALVGYALAVVVCHRLCATRPDDRAARWVLGGAVAATALAAIAAPHILRGIAGTSTFFIDNYGYITKILADFQHPLLGTAVVCFGFFTLFVSWKRPHAALWLAAMALVPLALSIWVWKRTQGTQYVFYLQPFVILLCATGVAGIADWMRSVVSPATARRAVIAVFAGAILLLPAYGYVMADDTTYARDIDRTADYRKVFAYLGTKRGPSDALITRNFRNYYYARWHAPVLDFGGERATHDLTTNEVRTFVCAHDAGSVVIFDNDWDFVAKDARALIETSLRRIDHSSVRGAARAYRWDSALTAPLCSTH